MAATGVWLLHRRTFRRRPEKGARYRALPLGYKLLCWCVVLPLVAGGFVVGPLLLLAILAYVLLEAACRRWYQRAGLWHR